MRGRNLRWWEAFGSFYSAVRLKMFEGPWLALLDEARSKIFTRLRIAEKPNFKPINSFSAFPPLPINLKVCSFCQVFDFFGNHWEYRNIRIKSDFNLVDVLKRFKVVSIMAQWLHFVASLAQWLIPSSKKSHQGSLQNIPFLIYSLNLFEGHFYQ